MSWHALELLREDLVELERIGIEFIDACLRNDVHALRTALVESRQARSALAKSSAILERLSELDDAHTEVFVQIARLSERQTLADQAFELWLTRPLPDERDLLGDLAGVCALVDTRLPMAWDYGTDLVVLIGDDMVAVAEELKRQGQRRVVAYLADPGTYPAWVHEAADLDQVDAAMGAMLPGSPSRMVCFQHPQVDLPEDARRQLLRRVDFRMVELRIHANTINAFGSTWIEQGIKNMPAIASLPSIGSVGEAFAGKPMVIVAPGPSLAKNIHHLPALRGKAVIVAFSHTMAALAAAGVRPDVVVTVDPQDVQYHFEGSDLSGVTLVNGATVHPALYELGAEHILTAAVNTVLDNWLYGPRADDARLASGGSVATSALSLGLMWKCEPIVFVGLDLSFDDGQYYVNSSCDGGTKVSRNDSGGFTMDGWSDGYTALNRIQGATRSRPEKLETLPGYYGGTVATSAMFAAFHDWFELTAETHGDRVRMINATEGGARIEGMEQIPLEQVVRELAGHSVDVRGAIARIVDDSGVGASLLEAATRIAEMLHSGTRCAKLVARCGSLARRALYDPESMRDLEKAEAELEDAIRPVWFVSMLAQAEIAEAQRRAVAASTTAEALAATIELLETVGTTVLSVIGPLEFALRRLEAQTRLYSVESRSSSLPKQDVREHTQALRHTERVAGTG